MKVLNNIKQGKKVTDKDFVIRKTDIIVFGLHEVGRPPTLICPRPRIKVRRKKNNEVYIENERFDDSMNIVLRKESPGKIFEAIFDESISFDYDLTNN